MGIAESETITIVIKILCFSDLPIMILAHKAKAYVKAMTNQHNIIFYDVNIYR